MADLGTAAQDVEQQEKDEEEGEENGESEHKKTAKELRAKIQALKKTSKGDKKKKKEVAVEVAKLEAQLEELSLQKKQQQNELKEKSCAEGAAPEVSAPKKLSKAQRRKERQGEREREREQRIEEGVVSDANNVRVQERTKLEQLLSPLRLRIVETRPDGNCLYAAISDQLSTKYGLKFTVNDLRHQCAEHIRSHSQDFLPFLTDPQSGDPLTEDQFQHYCDDIEHTAAWGGEPELRSLSDSLNATIVVYQAHTPPLIVGERDPPLEKTLLVSYHQHEYSLGHHYNSVVAL